MSYLNTPRLTFAGKFQADPSTVNNFPAYYSLENFNPQWQQLQTETQYNGLWNPDGTGNFRLVGCTVRSVTYKNGETVTDPKSDPIIGMNIMDSNTRVSGKIVDLDPQQQMVSMIYGMIVRLSDGNSDLFNGKFKPVAFNNIWGRSPSLGPTGGSQAAGASYQSVLTNVQYLAYQGNSRYLTELADVVSSGQANVVPDQLSIKFNVDLHDNTPGLAGATNDNFTIGRLVGVIGPSFVNEPDHFVVGRQLYPTSPKLNFATAIVDESIQSIILDLGNSLKTVGLKPDGSIDKSIVDIGTLQLASANAVAKQPFLFYGNIDYRAATWYEQMGGLATIPLKSQELIAKAQKNNLQVIQDGEILMDEVVPYLRADNFVFRMDPTDNAELNVYASVRGVAVPQGFSIDLSQQIEFLAGNEPPALGTPAEALTFNTPELTGANGKATFTLTAANPNGARLVGPPPPPPPATTKEPYSYDLDGQLYALWYNQTGQLPDFNNPPPSANQGDFVSVLVHDSFPILTPGSPVLTAWEQIQPVLQQYANLYPLMSKGIFDLSKQSVVDRNAKLLYMAFTLPVEDPNHMPVTRDLSRDKRNMIIAYLLSVINNG